MADFDLRKLIPIGFRLMKLTPDFKAALQAAAPIYEAWKRQAPTLVPLLKAAWREGKPVVDAVKAHGPTLFPMVMELSQKAFPEVMREISKETTAGYSLTWLQESLNKLGYTPKLDVDGIKGEKTDKAVEWFQKTFGKPYELEVDGWAGTLTCAAIFSELQKRK
jgi:hypothetical protein